MPPLNLNQNYVTSQLEYFTAITNGVPAERFLVVFTIMLGDPRRLAIYLLPAGSCPAIAGQPGRYNLHEARVLKWNSWGYLRPSEEASHLYAACNIYMHMVSRGIVCRVATMLNDVGISSEPRGGIFTMAEGNSLIESWLQAHEHESSPAVVVRPRGSVIAGTDVAAFGAPDSNGDAWRLDAPRFIGTIPVRRDVDVMPVVQHSTVQNWDHTGSTIEMVFVGQTAFLPGQRVFMGGGGDMVICTSIEAANGVVENVHVAVLGPSLQPTTTVRVRMLLTPPATPTPDLERGILDDLIDPMSSTIRHNPGGATIARLRARVQELTDTPDIQFTRSQEELERAGARIVELTASSGNQLARIAELLDINRRLTDQVAHSNEEIARARDQRDASNTRIAELVDGSNDPVIQELRQTIAGMSSRIEELQALNRGLTGQVNRTHEEISLARDQRDAACIELANLQRQLEAEA